jgi:hypothetical protein
MTSEAEITWLSIAARAALIFTAASTALRPGGVQAHGFAGDRFFPATILTDDPFVADEVSLPTASLNPPGVDGSTEIDFAGDISKRVTPDIGSCPAEWCRSGG